MAFVQLQTHSGLRRLLHGIRASLDGWLVYLFLVLLVAALAGVLGADVLPLALHGEYG